MSLWGAAAAVGAAAGPLLGGVLVELTGWQGLFWIDAVVAVVCMLLTAADGDRVARPGPAALDRLRRHRARRADPRAAHPRPEQGQRLGLGRRWPRSGCAGRGAVAGFAFVAVERRVAVPLLDLALLRNRVLVGVTIAILIGAGTINALMYLLSLYFQDPARSGFSPLRGGAGHPPGHRRTGRGRAARAPARRTVRRPPGGRRRGSCSPPSGSRPSASSTPTGGTPPFLLPLVAVAVGMGLSNGPASSASTACVSANQVGAASGVSNMARYVGAAVATALAATIYGAVIGDRAAEGQPPGDALASGLAAASWVMAVFSFAGVLMAVVMGRHRASRGTLHDAAAAAAAGTHTLPTSATPVETSSA